MLEQELEKAFDMWAGYYGKEQDFIDAVGTDCKPAGYSEYLLFSIEKFDGKKWPKYLFKKLVEKDKYNVEEYFTGLNGRPVKETSPKTQWNAGSTRYIMYGEFETVQISYSADNKYPDFVKKIEWENGRKKVYHSFHVNGGASYWDANEKDLIVDRFRGASNEYIWQSEFFKYDESGKVERVICYSNTPGIGQKEGYKIYTYNNGLLEKIEVFWGEQSGNIEYFRGPRNFTIRGFLSELSNLFYNVIGEQIAAIEEDSPIKFMTVSFQSVSNYWPYIKYITEVDAEELDQDEAGLFFFTVLLSGTELDIESNDALDEQFAILQELKDRDYRKHYGEKMWYLFARKLNKERHLHRNLSEDFFVFTHGDLADVNEAELKKNGATKEQLKYWKSQGFL